MHASRLASTRASVCFALAAAAALLIIAVQLLAIVLDEDRPGGSTGQLVVQYLYGPYVQLVAAALALFSIYSGLVHRYLVRSTDRRVRLGILMSLVVLVYLVYVFSRAIWE